MLFNAKHNRFNYIILPVKFIHEEFDINTIIHFCLDTGAPNSVISFEQAVKMSLEFDKLDQEDNLTRICGLECKCYILKDSYLLLRSDSGKLNKVPFSPFNVLEPSASQEDKLPVPGILGYDFISQFNFVVHAVQHGSRVYLTDEKVGILTA